MRLFVAFPFIACGTLVFAEPIRVLRLPPTPPPPQVHMSQIPHALSNATISPRLSNSTAPVSTTAVGNSTTLPVTNSAMSADVGGSATSTSESDSTDRADNFISTDPSDLNSPRGIVPKWLLMRVPKFRRIAQNNLPAVVQDWQDLSPASGDEVATDAPKFAYPWPAGRRPRHGRLRQPRRAPTAFTVYN
ncbi:hypothetical protein DENSPDRAFT_928168 [Dentipellis sp. KUC8613]|nr:hypothetical protein DENSPDRAFT_928168 [Dentipellis sp. KUC8613]